MNWAKGMNKEFVLSTLSFISAILIIFLVVSVSNRGGQVQVPDVDENLCPTDTSLIRENRLIVLDFSDPLPAAYLDYPRKILSNVVRNLSNQFDRIKLYILNPENPVPVKLSDFCIPFTIKSIPEEERKILWGRDPDLSRPLPARFKKHQALIEKLRAHEKSLEQTIDALIQYLADKGSESQHRSRLAGTIEELVAIQREGDHKKNSITILSDMLQNTEEFSHYKEGFDFDSYLASRKKGLMDMSGFDIDVHYLQTCKTMTFEDRRNHKAFWESYFAGSGVSADFKLLNVDDLALDCKNGRRIRARNSR